MKRFFAALLSLSLLSSLLPARAAGGVARFSDVSPDDWFAPYVEVCAEKGLLKGTDGGGFAPEAPVTAGEAVVMAARAMQLANGETGPFPRGAGLEEFVTEFLYERRFYVSQEAYDRAAAPVREGAALWVGSYAWDALWYLYYDGEHAWLEDLYALDPGDPVTRYQFFDTLGYASGGLLSPVLNAIDMKTDPDDQGRSWRIVSLYETGVLTGTDGDQAFAPDKLLTRAEAAAALARLARQDLRVGPAPHEPQEVASIYKAYSSFGFRDTETKLDLENGLYWSFSADSTDWENRVERDPNAENEGFQISQPLSPEAVANFRASDGLAALLDWDGEYIDYNISDGLHWFIRIVFTDGTSRGIQGSNAYPETWGLYNTDVATLLETSKEEKNK